jgi:hypothetical protein
MRELSQRTASISTFPAGFWLIKRYPGCPLFMSECIALILITNYTCSGFEKAQNEMQHEREGKKKEPMRAYSMSNTPSLFFSLSELAYNWKS